MISVIIPSYRNPTYLDLCLKSTFENQDNDNQIIVILDGYTSESKHVIKKYPDLNVVEFDENKGQMVAHNTGAMLAEGEWLLFVNDDNVFPRHWDASLNSLAAFGSKIIYSPNQIEPTPSIFKSFIQQDLGTTPTNFKYEEFLDFSDQCSAIYHQTEYNEPTYHVSPITPDGQSWPLFISKKWYMTLGGIDQNFPSAAVADWDFFMRCELAGLRCMRYHKLHLYHFAGAATRKVDKNWNNGEQQSFEYFQYKWGFYPSMNELNSRLPYVNEIIRGINFRCPTHGKNC